MRHEQTGPDSCSCGRVWPCATAARREGRRKIKLAASATQTAYDLYLSDGLRGARELASRSAHAAVHDETYEFWFAVLAVLVDVGRSRPTEEWLWRQQWRRP